MASPYSKGAQNAAGVGGLFDSGQFTAGKVSVLATSTVKTVTLAFTPDWVVAVPSVRTDGLYTVTISGTTTGLVTFTRAASTVADTIMYLAGDLT